MTMDIIDKRIYSCNEAICKNIESLQANERGLLSQNILSQLRNFLECVFLKIYVASGNSLIVCRECYEQFYLSDNSEDLIF